MGLLAYAFSNVSSAGKGDFGDSFFFFFCNTGRRGVGTPRPSPAGTKARKLNAW